MNRLTPEQGVQIVPTYFENHGSVRQTYRAPRQFYGRHKLPSEQVIRNTSYTYPQRRQTLRIEEVIAVVERSIEGNPTESISHRTQQLELCPSTLWKILSKDLGSKGFKIQLAKEWTPRDHYTRQLDPNLQRKKTSKIAEFGVEKTQKPLSRRPYNH